MVAKTTLPVIFCSLLSCAIYADSDIEEVTVIGKIAGQNAKLGANLLKNLPLNAHIVHQGEMERLRFVDPDEFLDRIPGETQVRNLRIPDGSKSYTIPMLDGLPLESPYEGATQRLDRTNTFDISRVEVIKGPASALYPNNAFGGVVNVVSKDSSEHPQHKIHIEAGDFSRFRAGLSSSGNLGPSTYVLDINSRRLDGLRDEQQNDRDQGSIKISYPLDETQNISLRLERLELEEVARGDLTAAQIAQDKTQAGGLSSSTELDQDSLALRYQREDEDAYIDAQIVFREKDTIGLSRFRGPQDENDRAWSARLLWAKDYSLGQLTLGGDFYRGDQDTLQYARNDTRLSGPATQFDNRLNINAYFTQWQQSLGGNTIVTAGLRFEDIQLESSLYQESADFDVLAPKLGVTHKLNDNISLWAAYSEGFYAPNMGQLFSLNNGNPNLDPEASKNAELGLRLDLWQVRIDGSIYHNKIKQFLVTQELTDSNGNDFEKTTNAGAVTVKGVEWIAEYQLQNLPLSFSLTHTYSKNRYDKFVQSTPGAADDLSGKDLRRSPKHHINTRAAWFPLEGLSIEIEGDFYSSYYADHLNSNAGKFSRDERLNLRLSYQTGAYRFWLHGLNLTDTLEDRATFSRGKMKFRTIDGRTLYAGMAYEF